MMQQLSHGARAYIINADLLNNFLVEAPKRTLIEHLIEADYKGELNSIKEWQAFDMEKLKTEFKGLRQD